MEERKHLRLNREIKLSPKLDVVIENGVAKLSFGIGKENYAVLTMSVHAFNALRNEEKLIFFKHKDTTRKL